jgi:hypothetical protein
VPGLEPAVRDELSEELDVPGLEPAVRDDHSLGLDTTAVEWDVDGSEPNVETTDSVVKISQPEIGMGAIELDVHMDWGEAAGELDIKVFHIRHFTSVSGMRDKKHLTFTASGLDMAFYTWNSYTVEEN